MVDRSQTPLFIRLTTFHHQRPHLQSNILGAVFNWSQGLILATVNLFILKLISFMIQSLNLCSFKLRPRCDPESLCRPINWSISRLSMQRRRKCGDGSLKQTASSSAVSVNGQADELRKNSSEHGDSTLRHHSSTSKVISAATSQALNSWSTGEKFQHGLRTLHHQASYWFYSFCAGLSQSHLCFQPICMGITRTVSLRCWQLAGYVFIFQPPSYIFNCQARVFCCSVIQAPSAMMRMLL